MSVRAYPQKIDYNVPDTFNLWHDDDIFDAIDYVGCYYSNTNGDVGLIVIDKPELEKIEEYLKEHKKLNEENKEILKAIEENIKKEIYNYLCW